MQRKLARLQQRLQTSLAHQYPGGVEMVCPDGVLSLVHTTAAPSSESNHFETPDGSIETKRSISPTTSTTTQDLAEMNPRAWWKNLDNVNAYAGLLESLQSLESTLRKTPCDAIIGFSQGATLATMLAALCEGTPARLRALATQGQPICIDPPQGPFKFALLSCGYKGTEKFYGGFYSPRLETPALFDTAVLDHMVEPAASEAWSAVGTRSQTMSRLGGHWFPTDEGSLGAMVSFAVRFCGGVDPGAARFESSSLLGDSKTGDSARNDSVVQWIPSAGVDEDITCGRSRCRCSSSRCTGLGERRSRKIFRRFVVVRGCHRNVVGSKANRSVGAEKG